MSYLSPRLPKAADENRPESRSAPGRPSLSPPSVSVSRPSLCSEAAPVRFSNCRIAAKSLPMPEEFPEQHSRSFSDCFETVLCLYFNTALSGQPQATGLSPAINGKHMCQAQTRSQAAAPMAAVGLIVTTTKDSASRTNAECSAILRVLLGGARVRR